MASQSQFKDPVPQPFFLCRNAVVGLCAGSAIKRFQFGVASRPNFDEDNGNCRKGGAGMALVQWVLRLIARFRPRRSIETVRPASPKTDTEGRKNVYSLY